MERLGNIYFSCKNDKVYDLKTLSEVILNLLKKIIFFYFKKWNIELINENSL